MSPVFYSLQPFFKAVPSLLIAGGILGTFIGLTFGLSSVFPEVSNSAQGISDEQLSQNIEGLIRGCSIAFKTSVWGVFLSILVTLLLKLGTILFIDLPLLRFHTKIDSLVPLYTPEIALLDIADSTQSSEIELKTLAQKIGAEMQTAVTSLGSTISKSLTGQSGEHAKEAGKQLKEGIVGELSEIRKVVNQLESTVGETKNFIESQNEVAARSQNAAQSMKESAAYLAHFGLILKESSDSQSEIAKLNHEIANKGKEISEDLSQVPTGITNASRALELSGEASKHGAESVTKSLIELKQVQENWNSGVKIGLEGIRDQLDSNFEEYGVQIQDQTKELLKIWSTEVSKSLAKFAEAYSPLSESIEELLAQSNDSSSSLKL